MIVVFFFDGRCDHCVLQTVRTFFWTNRLTCREWLSRVRLQLMLIAQSQHDWATVVRHGYLQLAELTESSCSLVMYFGNDNVNVINSVAVWFIDIIIL